MPANVIDCATDTGHFERAAQIASELGEFYTDKALAAIDDADQFRFWFWEAVNCFTIEQKLMAPINVNDVARR